MSHLAPPPPPLLLTKRVTAFLHANLSAHIHTAALTTPSGRLLAHASLSAPARLLRRQCAVAASLWAVHGQGSSSRAVTVRLEGGGAVFVIRALRCGVLLIAVGGEPAAADAAASSANTPTTPTPTAGTPAAAVADINGADVPPQPLGSPSDAASVLSAGAAPGEAAGKAAVRATRRQAEELAKWLDERLGPLSIPEEITGSAPDGR